MGAPNSPGLIVALGRDILSTRDTPSLLRQIVDAARDLTGARYAALGVLDRSGRGLAEFITAGVDEATQRAIGDLPRGHGVLGVLIDDPRPLRLADVGAHPRSYGFPPGHPPMRTFLGVPLLVRGEAWGNIYLAEKEGGEEFTEADEEALGVLALWAGIAIDNAEAYRREHERRDELEQAVAALEATTDIARALGGETDLDVVLELIVKRGRNLVGARGVVILLRDGDALEIRAQAGELATMVGRRVPVQGSVSGHVLTAGRPERLRDVPHRLHATMARAIDAEHGLFVPLLFRGRGVGVLCAFDRVAGGDFTSADERLLEAFAASAATAVATAQSAATRELQRSIEASEAERRRWARELHDETLQDLAALKLLLAGAAADDASASASPAIPQAIEQLSLSITGLRNLISELRPAALDELGVGSALDALTARLSSTSELEIATDIRLAFDEGDADRRLVPAVEETVYRLVQEALNNAIKHASATRVEIEVVEDEHVVKLCVSDDGEGFDTALRTQGFGLVGMRERVALVGGTLDVTSTPGQGTALRAVLPARRRAAGGVAQPASPGGDSGAGVRGDDGHGARHLVDEPAGRLSQP